MRAHGIPVVVAVNAFTNDPASELEWVCRQSCEAGAIDAAISTHWADGGKGAEELAGAVLNAVTQGGTFAHLYRTDWSIRKKIETIATTMYEAAGVSFGQGAEQQMEIADKLGFGHLPICMAKTPLSLSHDPALKGRPVGFILPIKELRILAGAGFLTAVSRACSCCPACPKNRRASESI